MSVLVSVKLVHWTTNLLLDLSAPFPVSVSGCAVLMVVLSAQNLIFDKVFAVLLTLVFDHYGQASREAMLRTGLRQRPMLVAPHHDVDLCLCPLFGST